MSAEVWKQHFMDMAQGKAIKKKNYYIVNVTPTQQAVEMAKDKLEKESPNIAQSPVRTKKKSHKTKSKRVGDVAKKRTRKRLF